MYEILFLFGHADCPDHMLPKNEMAMHKSRKKVAALKMWQKIVSAALAVVLMGAAVWYFFEEQKDCCLCNSFRFHAPCLVDLATGEMVELD